MGAAHTSEAVAASGGVPLFSGKASASDKTTRHQQTRSAKVRSGASVGPDDAGFLAWTKGFVRELLGRRVVTTHEAAQALGRAAAEARARKNLTIAEKREALHAQLRAAREAGFVNGVRVR